MSGLFIAYQVSVTVRRNIGQSFLSSWHWKNPRLPEMTLFSQERFFVIMLRLKKLQKLRTCWSWGYMDNIYFTYFIRWETRGCINSLTRPGPCTSVWEWWGSKNRRNVFKFIPGNNNDTFKTSGKSEFIWFSSYRDIGQKRNSDTKSLKKLDSLWAWVSCAHSKENSLYPSVSHVFVSGEIVM